MADTEKIRSSIAKLRADFDDMVGEADRETVLALQKVLLAKIVQDKIARAEGVMAVSGGSCEEDSC